MYSSETNDAALVVRTAGGDHLALLTLYDRYAAVLLALTQHIIGPGSEAEELVQDVFLEVWRRAGTYQPQHGTVRSWMILRTRELALEALRLHPELAAQHSPGRFFPSDWPGLSRTTAATLEDPIFGQERVAVQGALSKVDTTRRTVLELAYFQALPHPTIATELKITPQDVATHLGAAFQELRPVLQDVRR